MEHDKLKSFKYILHVLIYFPILLKGCHGFIDLGMHAESISCKEYSSTIGTDVECKVFVAEMLP